MSYILDALKQNEKNNAFAHGPNTMHEQYYSANKRLQTYRKISFVLALVVVLGLGFVAGKYVQNGTVFGFGSDFGSHKMVPVAFKDDQAGDNKVSYHLVPVEQIYQSHANVKVPTDEVAKKPQVKPTTEVQVAQVKPVVDKPKPITKPINTQPKPTPTPQRASQKNSMIVKNGDEEIDLSQYRVLGKPLENQPATSQNQYQSSDTDLSKAFSDAFAQLDGDDELQTTRTSKQSAEVANIVSLPRNLQSQIPAMHYQAHVYASEPQSRWLKINDQALYQGDEFEGVRIIEISEQQTLMSYQGYRFTVSAMEDWNY